MSEANVDVVRGIYEAFGKGDVPAVLGALDPAVEWWEAEGFIYADGNPYRGPDAVLQGVFARLMSDWDGFAVTPEGVLDAGDTIVGHGYYTGTHKQTGKAVRAQFAHMFRIRDGKVHRFRQYTDTAQFMSAIR
jgi:ketosteroid isomerase-like protein